MFDITELDEMVCSQLGQTSLARCAQVTKTWNKVITPYVWRKISANSLLRDGRAFRQLVLEDHQLEQQYLAQQPLTKEERKSTQVAKSKSVSQNSETMEQAALLALTKYGRYVCQVDSFTNLVLCLGQELIDGGESNPAEYSAGDLVRHFLKRCPNARLNYDIFYEHIKSPAMFLVVMEALPRVRTLTINGSNDHRTPFPKGSANAPALPDIIARPKHLKLGNLETDGPVGDISWIWRACGQVKELEVSQLSDDVMFSLIQFIQHSMPSLDSITLGNTFLGCGRFQIPEYYIKAILATGNKGLEVVHCTSRAHMGCQAFYKLLQNASTLKEFTVGMVLDESGILRVLKLCPNLRKLTALAGATDFIDWDPELNAPRPWPCKTTLETLAIKIAGLPGEHDGDRRFLETQQRVCERLAEFTNLKYLRLGHTAELCLPHASRRSTHRWRTVAKQGRCLHLTLATGLSSLSGLKKLEELHIPNMDHRVKKVAEVEWMVEHWPHLSKIIGLAPASHAYMWIKEIHPEIHLELPSSR
ncbi:hypothetical protein BGZ82_008418 [Podila clonocystis]|nr:hypothetical protein BGZ82_008418 [Podila clonocystis]